ncbi:kinase-like domain-containing protein, partial [Phellopilus nigrolimitatus]
FTSQPYRRFVLGMAIFRDYVTFHYFDRAGVIASDTFNIHEHPEKFLRIVIGFLFSSKTELGYDNSIVVENGSLFITVKDKKFRLEQHIYAEPCIRGRGTACYLASLDGKQYVIKDSWVDDNRQSPEQQILKHLHGVAGVPTIAAYDAVKIGREKDTTRRLRKVFKKQKFFDKRELKWRSVHVKADDREHRRLVTTPYGDPLESFSSLIELISATRDLILIVRDLARKNVLHGDISLRNIILARLDENSPLRRAFLIDYDSAINFVKQKDLHERRYRTGTVPYMALEILTCDEDGDPEVAHTYYHDLESIFYVLCWICTVFQGPDSEKREDLDYENTTIAGWMAQDPENVDHYHIRLRKKVSVVNRSVFKKDILGQFAPYFDDLHPCLSAMRLVLFNRNAGYDEVKEGREALDKWATMSQRERERAPGKYKEKVRQAKRVVPLAYQYEDEVISDLVKICDDTLDDLAKKCEEPSTAPARSTRRLRSAAKSKRALSPDASLESNPKRSKRGND